MSGYRHLTDLEIDGLLAGAFSATECALVAAYLAELKAAFPEAPVAAEVGTAHLAAVAAAIEGGSTIEPAPRPRRRPLRLVLKVAVVSAALLLLFSGLALAGALPPSIEGPLSRAALRLGVHLPGEPLPPAGGQAEHPDASPSARSHLAPSERPHPSHSPSPAPHKQKSHDEGDSGQSGSGAAAGAAAGSAAGGGGSGDQSGDQSQSSTTSAQQDGDGDSAADEQESPETDQDPPPDDQDPPEDPGDGGDTDQGDAGDVPDRTGD